MPPPRIHPPPIIEIDGEGLTPELKVRCIEAELKNEEKKINHEYEDSWDCCLSKRKTDSRLIKYLFQMSIILAIITLCIVRLSEKNLPCEVANTYVGILTLLIGICLPSPSSGKK